MKALLILVAILAIINATMYNRETATKRFQNSELNEEIKQKKELQKLNIHTPAGYKGEVMKKLVGIANQYLPIIKEAGENIPSLEFNREWEFELPGIRLVIDFNFRLDVGWRVTISDLGHYHVRYEAFAIGQTYLWNDFYTNFSTVWLDPYLTFLNFSMPIDLEWHDNGDVCVRSSYQVSPVLFDFLLGMGVSDCQMEVLGVALGQTSFNPDCDEGEFLYNPIIERALLGGIEGGIVDTCINF